MAAYLPLMPSKRVLSEKFSLSSFFLGDTPYVLTSSFNKTRSTNGAGHPGGQRVQSFSSAVVGKTF